MAELVQCLYCHKKRLPQNMEKHLKEEHTGIIDIFKIIDSIPDVGSYTELEDKFRDIFRLIGLELNISNFSLTTHNVDVKDKFWGSRKLALDTHFTKEELEIKYHPLFKVEMIAQGVIIDVDKYFKNTRNIGQTLKNNHILTYGSVNISYSHNHKVNDVIDVNVRDVFMFAKLFKKLSKIYFSQNINHQVMTKNVQEEFNENCSKIKEEYDVEKSRYLQRDKDFIDISNLLSQTESLVESIKYTRNQLIQVNQNDFILNHKIKLPELTSPYLKLDKFNILRDSLNVNIDSREVISDAINKHISKLEALCDMSKKYIDTNPEQFL